MLRAQMMIIHIHSFVLGHVFCLPSLSVDEECSLASRIRVFVFFYMNFLVSLSYTNLICICLSNYISIYLICFYIYKEVLAHIFVLMSLFMHFLLHSIMRSS